MSAYNAPSLSIGFRKLSLPTQTTYARLLDLLEIAILRDQNRQRRPESRIPTLGGDEDARIDQRSQGEVRSSALARRSRMPASISSANSGSGG
jgi:hypothetical protein